MGNDGDLIAAGNLLAESRDIWDTNAEAWDTKIGGGGGWQSTVIAPTVEQMLDIQPGERVLDIACGNGIFTRRLAALGAYVVASDFSPRLIEFARLRTTEHADRIEYHVADATDQDQLLALAGQDGRRFDAAVCNNALMDMPAVEPLFRAVAQLLKPGGRFVFSVMHPCFNGQSISMQAELPDYATEPTYSIKITRYLSAEVTRGLAIENIRRGQPDLSEWGSRNCPFPTQDRCARIEAIPTGSLGGRPEGNRRRACQRNDR